MSRFNTYMNSHFQQGECRLIARAFDECRSRAVSLYAMPGHWDVVGVTDGTDAWIAPASAGLFFKTATGDCTEQLRRLAAGDELLPVPDAPASRRRVRLQLDEPQPAAQPQQQPQRRERVRL